MHACMVLISEHISCCVSALCRLKPYDVPATVFKEAPDFCTVYIILNGKVSSCKNATRPAPTIGYFRQDLMEDGIIDDSIPESNSPIILQHPQFMLPPDSYLPNINFNSENKEILIMLEEKDFSKKIDGFPTISFTESEYHASLISTKSLALVRCSHGTPDLATTRKFFIQKLSPMLGRFSILQWKKYSFLVNFKCYDDYLKALMLESFSQGKFTFRFSKWFPGYLNGGESPLLPTWIEFPDLDINWYSEEFVTALASCFGKVLKVAETTKRLEEGAEAKVCVERDISCPLPEKMWIDICGQGYWQKVRAVTKQKYCSCCYKRGHDTKECRKNNKDQLPTSFTPKKKKTIDQETTSSPHAEQETQITKFITSIEKDLSNFLQDQAKLHFPMESQNQLDNQDDKLDDTGDVKTTNQEEKESSEMSNQADSSSSSSPSDQPNERPT